MPISGNARFHDLVDMFLSGLFPRNHPSDHKCTRIFYPPDMGCLRTKTCTVYDKALFRVRVPPIYSTFVMPHFEYTMPNFIADADCLKWIQRLATGLIKWSSSPFTQSKTMKAGVALPKQAPSLWWHHTYIRNPFLGKRCSPKSRLFIVTAARPETITVHNSSVS